MGVLPPGGIAVLTAVIAGLSYMPVNNQRLNMGFVAHNVDSFDMGTKGTYSPHLG